MSLPIFSLEECLRIAGVIERLISSWKCTEGFFFVLDKRFTSLGFSFSTQKRKAWFLNALGLTLTLLVGSVVINEELRLQSQPIWVRILIHFLIDSFPWTDSLTTLA